MGLNINLSTASAQAGAVPTVPANPPTITAAAGQVNNVLTLPNGTVINQIDSDAEVIRDFEYLGNYNSTGKLVNPGE